MLLIPKTQLQRLLLPSVIQRVSLDPARASRARVGRPPVEELVGALLAGGEPEVHALCDGFARCRGSRVQVIVDLLQAAMQQIAELWYQGDVGGAGEARAARLVASAVERLPPTPAATPVAAGSRCLLVQQPADGHTLGLRALALALEDEGWVVDIVLAVDWPSCLEQVRSGRRPRFVGISVGCRGSDHQLGGAVRALTALRLPVLVGGIAFRRSPGLWQRVGATAYAADARVGVVLARRFAPRGASAWKRPHGA